MRRAPRGRASSPVLHSRLHRMARLPRPVAAGFQLLLSDGAQHLLGLRLAQRRLTAAPAPAPTSSAAARRSAGAASARRLVRLAAASAPAAPHRELEVPFCGAVARSEEERLAVGALRVTEVAVAPRAVGGRLAQRQQPEVVKRSEEHTSELQSPYDLVCRLLLEKKK